MATRKPAKAVTKAVKGGVAKAAANVGDAARKAQMTKIIMDNTGWRGAELETAVAIMLRESNGNPGAYNGNRATGDDSYGLFQLNTLGNLWNIYRGMGITDRKQLLDPATNARAAYALYQRNGNTFHPWLGYRAGLTVSKQSAEAKQLLAQTDSQPATATLLSDTKPLTATFGAPADYPRAPTAKTGTAVDYPRVPAENIPRGGELAAGLRSIQSQVTPPATTTAPLTTQDLTPTGGGRQGSPSIAAAKPTSTTATSNVAQYENGRIPADQLVHVEGGILEAHAAEAYNRMLADAQAQGVPLGITDSYRTYDQQVSLVKNKGLYSQGGLGATPGTSQHGWGQAIDIKGGAAATAWMQANAARYGFTADTPREDWHYTYTGPGAVAPRTQKGTTSPTPSGQTDVHGNGLSSGDPADDELRGALGWMSAFLDVPEVGDILRDHAAGRISDAQYQGRLQDTLWWKTTQDTARLFDGLMATDPATANAQVASKMADIQTQATQLGFSLDAGSLRDLAITSIRLGMNATEIAHAIGGESMKEGRLGDSTTHQGVRKNASDYGIPMSDAAVDQWTNQIATGQATTEDLRQTLVAQAKGLYPQFSDGLDRGLTVVTLADPYIQTAARNLGVNPDSISIADPKWSGAITGADPKTGQQSVLPLDAFQTKIRTDPLYGWQNTKLAKDQAYAFGAQLGQAFGAYQGTPGGSSVGIGGVL